MFTLSILTCVCVLPSYTNTCAKPDAAFMKSCTVKDCQPETTVKTVRRASGGLEVFPLELISIQL